MGRLLALLFDNTWSLKVFDLISIDFMFHFVSCILINSILGNGNKWFDCTSDKQLIVKLSRNIASVQCQGPNKTWKPFTDKHSSLFRSIFTDKAKKLFITLIPGALILQTFYSSNVCCYITSFNGQLAYAFMLLHASRLAYFATLVIYARKCS